MSAAPAFGLVRWMERDRLPKVIGQQTVWVGAARARAAAVPFFIQQAL